MLHWTEIVALIIIAAAVIIPAAMAAPMVFGIVSAWREERKAVAQTIACVVPDLGKFTSTGLDLWFGEVQGLSVCIDTHGGPPTDAHAAQVKTLTADLPRLAKECQDYLASHKQECGLNGDSCEFELYGLDFKGLSSFVVELTDPSDNDGVYRVEFQNGKAVRSGRDD